MRNLLYPIVFRDRWTEFWRFRRKALSVVLEITRATLWFVVGMGIGEAVWRLWQ